MLILVIKKWVVSVQYIPFLNIYQDIWAKDIGIKSTLQITLKLAHIVLEI